MSQKISRCVNSEFAAFCKAKKTLENLCNVPMRKIAVPQPLLAPQPSKHGGHPKPRLWDLSLLLCLFPLPYFHRAHNTISSWLPTYILLPQPASHHQQSRHRPDYDHAQTIKPKLFKVAEKTLHLQASKAWHIPCLPFTHRDVTSEPLTQPYVCSKMSSPVTTPTPLLTLPNPPQTVTSQEHLVFV
jgi:hypothetical protein